MKYLENSDFSFPKLNNCFVYFLVDKEEVVYVGKTTQGIVRPLSHKDKNFERIEIVFVDKKNLDEEEGKYILKYLPKYNFAASGYFSLQSVKKKIRELTGKRINLWDIKSQANKQNVNLMKFGKLFYVSPHDCEILISAFLGGD